MIWPRFRRAVLGAFVTLLSFYHAAQHAASALSMPLLTTATLPTVFDGQYTNPTANNTFVEWKYFQSIGDTVHGNAYPSLSVVFYQGYAFQFGSQSSTRPEYHLELLGTFGNGTPFALVVPADFAHISAEGQKVTGTWGSVARFYGQPDKSYTATFTAPQFGFVGTLHMEARGTHHLACNTTTDATFSSAIPPGTVLTPAEDFMYKSVVWLTSIPNGRSAVDVYVKGSRLRFQGRGYHDANAAPAPLDTAVAEWYSGVGQVGKFSIAFIYAMLLNSTRTLSTGYLARDGVVLQNRCSAHGLSARDAVTVTPYGAVNDTVSQQIIPAGFMLGYTLESGEQYQFNLIADNRVQIFDIPPYHRWAGSIEGGEVGGETVKESFVFEWLNAVLKPYVPPA